MPDIETIVREINRDLAPEFEKKLRAHLVKQEKEWLIEQIVRLTLDAHLLEEMDRKHLQEAESRKRHERTERAKSLHLDENKLQEFIHAHRDASRESLIEKNLLAKHTPPKGGELITEEHRSIEGGRLLQQAKDLLFALLFGEESTNTQFRRTERQLLTLTLPRAKSDVLDFMKSTTRLQATGTWQDPDSGAREVEVDTVLLEIEYGETEDQTIGRGIITALQLINNLEINEEVLYGRLEKVEQSTLIP